MIPKLDPFGGVTFNDLSSPSDRHRRAEACLEEFEFYKAAGAFRRGGAFARYSDWDTTSSPYHLGGFRAEHGIDIRDIGIEDAHTVYFRGPEPDVAAKRRDAYRDYIEERNKNRNQSTNHFGSWPLLPDFEMFASYQEFYPLAQQHETMVRREDVYLVFGLPGIMQYLLPHDINKFGWAIWKYIDQNIPQIGLHPYWSFERPRDPSLINNWTQGSGYEFTIRLVPDRDKAYLDKTSPAFMLYNQKHASALRTFLDTLGLYDHHSVNYEKFDPVPVFPMMWNSSTSGSRPIIRGADFIVV